jgi:predicted Rdx family selenoprotein
VKGVFKISVDGEVVYDKADAGHKPTPKEAAKAVEPRLGQRLNWRNVPSD